MAEHQDTDRISVSRGALRADLAEMELRLKEYITLQLAGKADAIDLQSGDQERWVESVVYRVLDSHDRKGWTRRERALALLNICMTAAIVVLSIVAALHGVVIP